MDYNKLEIRVQKKWEYGMVEIWLFERVASGTNFFYHNGDEMVSKFVEQGTISNEIKPFLQAPDLFANSLFKAIADYTSEQGIKTKDENHLQGKLEATELHLQDMREISKKLLKLQKS